MINIMPLVTMMNTEQIETLAWGKMNGLLPAIVQDARSQQILMMGYMN